MLISLAKLVSKPGLEESVNSNGSGANGEPGYHILGLFLGRNLELSLQRIAREPTGILGENDAPIKAAPIDTSTDLQQFDANYEERTPVELNVAGNFPSYTAGILYRIGPGKSSVDTEQGDIFRVSHWFDGFSQTHRFEILAENGSSSSVRVLYSSRFSTDHLIEEVRRSGAMEKISFGQNQDPCRAVYKKAQSTYEPSDPSMQNIGVTLSVNMPGLDGPYIPPNGELQGRWSGSSDIRTLYAKTDSTSLKKLDPVTLEPIGLATQSSLHPDLAGPFSASHARSDPVTGDMFNFDLTFGQESIYRIFRVSGSTGKTTILATFPGVPAYIHSLF